jgi:hypothetical protein
MITQANNEAESTAQSTTSCSTAKTAEFIQTDKETSHTREKTTEISFHF